MPAAGKAWGVLKHGDEVLGLGADLAKHTDEAGDLAKHSEGVTGPTRHEIADLSKVEADNIGNVGGCFIGGTLVATQSGLVDIATLKVGDRVLTTDSLGQENFTAIVPFFWRSIRLRMPVSEHPADTLDIVLLRPLEWIISMGVAEGGSIDFTLEEMGVPGTADVVNIGPCPEITNGRGRVVVTTVTHENHTIHRLRFEGNTVLEPTAAHLFYSVDRQSWVSAGNLVAGEKLWTQDSTIRLSSNEVVEGSYRVYNLQVEFDQCYLVSQSFILSHNTCPPGGKRLPQGVPSIKKVNIDWEHIFERHSDWGEVAKQSGRKTIFEGADENQIREIVKGAYQNIVYHERLQGNKILMRGRYKSWDVEMYINLDTKTLETAYPIGR